MPRLNDTMQLSPEEYAAYRAMKERGCWEYHSISCICDLCLYLDEHWAYPGKRTFGKSAL